jgi:hypothetical protein
MSGEGRALLEWVRACMACCDGCESCPASGAAFTVSESEPSDVCALELNFVYNDERYLKCRKFKDGSRGQIEADLGKGKESIVTRVKPLAAEQVLAEAFFF